MADAPVLNEHNKNEYPPMHSAEHILNRTMVNMFGCERSKNAHIERKKSKCDYHLSQAPTQEQIEEIERRVNQVIASHQDVTVEFVDRAHLPADVDLSKLPENASETLRLVRIGDYDVCACIGTLCFTISASCKVVSIGLIFLAFTIFLAILREKRSSA